jgi:Rod binding domain-containing protein
MGLMRIGSIKTSATTAGNPEDKELKKACQDFETVFAEIMLKSMRATVPESGLMEGKQESFYRDMLDQEYAKSIAQRGGLGIADALYKALSNGGRQAAIGTNEEKIKSYLKGQDVPLK